MRIALLCFAVLVMALGVAGLIAPDTMMAMRREYMTAGGSYIVAAIRVAGGVLLILDAPASRVPKLLRVLGIIVCAQGVIQGVGTPFITAERAREIFDWEAMHPALLRVGAMIAMAVGALVAYGTRSA